MDKWGLVERAEEVWKARVAEIPKLRKQAKEGIARETARIEAELGKDVARRQADAARAIHAALEAGATKTALRKVTTSDHYGFEGYVERGAKLAEAEE